MIASSASSTALAASLMPLRATETSRSRTVLSSRTDPTNWGMTPTPPLVVTVPASGWSSPVMSRARVVLPAPFGPTSATTAPWPTRKLASLSSIRPSGR